jgi:hypothetical protein
MNVLLLAPKFDRAGAAFPDYRSALFKMLGAHGHDPIIMETVPDAPGETLRHKFLRLAASCDQAILIWPPQSAMATTADELILLQEVHEGRDLEIILILHEAEVEQREHELHVHAPHDQSRYLDGILECRPLIIPWGRDMPFESVVAAYADAFL